MDGRAQRREVLGRPFPGWGGEHGNALPCSACASELRVFNTLRRLRRLRRVRNAEKSGMRKPHLCTRKEATREVVLRTHRKLQSQLIGASLFEPDQKLIVSF